MELLNLGYKVLLMKKFPIVLAIGLILFLVYLSTCEQNDAVEPMRNPPVSETAPFDEAETAGTLENNNINEASGLTASRMNAQALWTHNDSGNEPVLFLIGTDGASLGSFYIEGVENRDWEDIAVGPGPEDGKNYIYIGDIGDNMAIFEAKQIYRIAEFEVTNPGKNRVDTVRSVSVISFRFPDGNFDAETLMVDPLTKDIFVISKRESFVGIYRAAYPQSTAEVIELKRMGEFPIKSTSVFDQIVAGDISPDGMEVLLKSYGRIFYWRRKSANQTINDLLQEAPMILPYVAEPQGEAITFAVDGSGYYTLSEENQNIKPVLYFYKRLDQ